MNEFSDAGRQTNSATQVIGAIGIAAADSFGTPTFWMTGSFAQLWFADARMESLQAGANARRKEILFAVAASESYLLEWVRDQVLNRDFAALDAFFPVDKFQPIVDKWRDVPKALQAAGHVATIPQLDVSNVWSEFQQLVKFRNGLLHARSSRPETAGLPAKSLPIPSLSQLNSLQAGWAIGVVHRLVSELHSDTGSVAPPWLTSP